MEQKPRADILEPDEEPKNTEGQQDTKKQSRESEFTKSTLHAAENAKRLGMDAETFQALSLRDRTALDFFDVPENYSETESQDNNSHLIFMDTGATYGEAFFPYTPEIQKKIHEEYLQHSLQSPDFGKKLLKENQKWQEQIIENDKKALTTQATGVFRDIMHSRYADPSELVKTNGLKTEEFLELLQLEESTSQTTITTEYLKNADIEFDGTKNLAWHIENAKYFEKAYTDRISKKEYKDALEGSRQYTFKMRSIKRVYDALIDKKTQRNYRPLKNNRANPYRISLKYYSNKGEMFYEGERKYRIELDRQYGNTKTSLKDAIDSIKLFCEQNNLELNLGDINLEKGKISEKQIDDFIENNTESINEFFDTHNIPYRKARAALDRTTTSLRIKQAYANQSDFKQALESSPFYEDTLHEIYKEAKYLDVINIIYRNASEDYLTKIKTNHYDDKKATDILADFENILNYAQESKIPLRSESSKLEDAELYLAAEYGITDKISGNAEKILADNHKKFSTELYECIRALKDFKALTNKYDEQQKARQTLSKRFRDANSSNQGKGKRNQQSQYYYKLKRLGGFTKCVRQAKQNIRSEFYLKYRPKTEEDTEKKVKPNHDQIVEQDLVRNSLDLPYELDKLDLPSQDEITEKLERQLKLYHITDKPAQYVSDLLVNEKRACELKIKLALGSRMDKKRVYMKQSKRERELPEEERNQHLTPIEAARLWADNYTKQDILEDKKLEIAQSLGYIDKAKSVLFMPGYAIIHNEEGRADILPVSSEDIKNTKKPGLRDLKPFVDMPPFCSGDETAIARVTLNRILQNEVLKNEAVGANKHEQRILNFQEKTGIVFPQIGIEQITGQLRPEPTEAELNGLETIYPFFGKFITRAEKSAYYIASPDNLVKQAENVHKEFICNSPKTSGYIIFQDRAEGRGVNLEGVANILRAKSINSGKALEILAYDAAICDYSSLSQGEIAEYQKAAKDKIPADARTFMLLYQKMIANPTELQKCAIKLSYCREFSRYCAGGASTPELKAFFDKRSEKAKEV